MIDKLRLATETQTEIFLVSIAVTAFGLGALSDISIRSNAVIIAAIGVMMHLWSIYKVYLRR